MALTVEVVPVERMHPLRSRVLREGRPHEGFPEDDDAATLHLAAVDDGDVVGVATFVPRPDGSWQLRGMAVDDDRQGAGIGRALLAEGERRVRGLGGALLWANGRDSALGFYERAGWVVEGEGYVLHDRPHHRVVRPLDDRR